MKTLSKIFILVVLIVFTSFLKAQNNPNIKRTYHWFFGNYAGLDFNNGTPIVDNNGQLSSDESCTTISDVNGNLLFYSDGISVWDRNHQIMPNGTGLGGCQSSTQGALIVPKPNDSLIYYLFTTDCIENNLQNGLRFSIIDISQNGGYGDVVEKNTLLIDSITEKVTATFHSNKNDIWIITHGWNNSLFYSFLLTNTGIDTIPVISNIGSIYSSSSLLSATGQIKISPNGEMLSSTHRGSPALLELFNFDKNNGIIYNLISLPAEGGEYGLSFSTNNSKLYVTIESMPFAKIYQFDLSSGVSSTIISSKIEIDSDMNSFYNSIQLAPDGKIYLAYYNLTGFGDYLAVINNPDSIGIACDFVKEGIFIPNKIIMGLQNYIDGYINDLVLNNNYLEIQKDNYNIYPYHSNDILILKTNFVIKNLISIEIYDVWGRKQNFIFSESENEINIDINLFNTGTYFFIVNIDDKIFRGKIIIY
ncbi:MAG: T9SS type A sorting domain-containing protein [Bacteroidota bacterium]